MENSTFSFPLSDDTRQLLNDPQAIPIASILSSLQDAVEANLAAHGATELSAYVPAKELVDRFRFKNYKALKRYLDAHPEIKTRKPTRQRLEVHAAMFKRALQEERKLGDAAQRIAENSLPEMLKVMDEERLKKNR
jgi:hypothetical protein